MVNDINESHVNISNKSNGKETKENLCILDESFNN